MFTGGSLSLTGRVFGGQETVLQMVKSMGFGAREKGVRFCLAEFSRLPSLCEMGIYQHLLPMTACGPERVVLPEGRVHCEFSTHPHCSRSWSGGGSCRCARVCVCLLFSYLENQ